MKMLPYSRFCVLCLGYFLALSINVHADIFTGKVSDLDAGNGYLTVTNPADETTKTFKVTPETAIATSNGQASQLLDLVEGTLVAVDVDPGDGRLAARITVLPAAQEPP